MTKGKNMKCGIAKVSGSLAVGLLALSALSAKADIITFNISNPNSGISAYTGPYATVEVNRTSSTTATITFTSLVHGGNIFLLAGAGAVDLNVNATGFSVGTITGSNSGTGGFTPGPWTTGSGNVNGFGVFNLTVDSFDGFQHSSDTISFTLTDTGGTWGSAGSVLAANANGSTAAIHGFITASPADAHGTVLATGYASNGQEIPDGGSTVALLGLAMLGIGSVRRFLA